MRKNMLCAEERSGKVYRKSSVPVFQLDVLHQGRWAGNSRVVDQDVYPGEFSQGRRHYSLNVGLLSYVGVHRNGTPSLGCDLFLDTLDFRFGGTGKHD